MYQTEEIGNHSILVIAYRGNVYRLHRHVGFSVWQVVGREGTLSWISRLALDPGESSSS
jgi:hypothetical protein